VFLVLLSPPLFSCVILKAQSAVDIILLTQIDTVPRRRTILICYVNQWILITRMEITFFCYSSPIRLH